MDTRLWSRADEKLISGFTSPYRIQEYLDSISYSDEQTYRCPLRVIQDRKAHCFDGAIFAAAMIRRLGHPPLISYMIAENDDDHCLALFKQDNHWGAVAKSNYVGLRFREPIYRNLRELMMSYFEDFFNVRGEKSLRSYTMPLNLKTFDHQQWMTKDKPLHKIADRLDEIRIVRLISRKMVKNLSPVDERSLRAGLMGANPAGLYRPE